MMTALLKALSGDGSAWLRALAGSWLAAPEAPPGSGAPGSSMRPPPSARRPDSGLAALNCLPRPIMALMVVALMAWAPFDPDGFTRAMHAYEQVPEWLGTGLFGVAAFYFTTRHLERRLELKGPPPDAPTPLADSGIDNPTLAAWAQRQP